MKSVAADRVAEFPKLQLVADHSRVPITLLHYIGVFLFMGWPGFYVSLAIVLPALHRFSMPIFTAVVGIMSISMMCTAELSKQPEWACNVIGAWILEKSAEYFKVRLYCEDLQKIQTAGTSILVSEPHDVMPVSMCVFSRNLDHLHPHKFVGCVTSSIFAVPLMKHFMAWTRAVDADRQSISNLINRGESPTICPGGVQEVLEMEPGSKECVLYLKRRRGIVKLALKHGTPILPSFTFGQRDAYSFWIPRTTWMRKLSSKLQFSPMVYFGIFNLPFSQPRPVHVNVVVGTPIKVEKNEAFTDKDIDGVQDELLTAMERIYEQNKEKFGMGDIKLRII